MRMLEVDSEITLREICLEDTDDIFSLIHHDRDYLREWLPFVDKTHQPEDTRYFIESLVSQPENLREPTFVILFNNEVAGITGFRGTEHANHRTEIGYWLGKRFQGKKIITRSCRKLMEFAFINLNMNRIQIRVAVGNFKSECIPYFLKFRFEGIERDGELLNGRYTNLKVYSLLAEEYFRHIDIIP